jgi:hypothetical protein
MCSITPLRTLLLQSWSTAVEQADELIGHRQAFELVLPDQRVCA